MRNHFVGFVWLLFDIFEKIGIHVLPVHYYSPIPDTRWLKKRMHLFEEEHPMDGVELNPEGQKKFLREVVAPFEQEYVAAGNGVFGTNEKLMPSFAPINGLMLYALIRHFKPKKLIEVGAGLSTRVSVAAFVKNNAEGHRGSLVSIEPYPSEQLKHILKNRGELIEKRVEELSTEIFEELVENDILFIDSSHAVKVFGDVNYLFLKVLPRLNPGVIIHVHDIYFPLDYLPHHFFSKHSKQIWQEQYLLHAFLMFNREFEILLGASYLHHKFPEFLKVLFSWYDADRWPSSFWMRRKTVHQ